MYDRFGLKRCVMVSITAVAVGALATLAMNSTWQFTLLWGVVMGVSTGAVSVTLAAVVANRWFVARRGSRPASSPPPTRRGSCRSCRCSPG